MKLFFGVFVATLLSKCIVLIVGQDGICILCQSADSNDYDWIIIAVITFIFNGVDLTNENRDSTIIVMWLDILFVLELDD